MTIEYKKKEFEKLKKEIISWFFDKYLNKDGIPYAEIDGISGRIIGKKDLLPELGDYLPFIYYYGQKKFAREQLDLGYKLLKEKNLLKKSIRKPKNMKFYDYILLSLFPKIEESFDFTDMLLGYVEIAQLEKDEKEKKKIIEIIHDIVKIAEKKFKKNKIWYDWRTFLFGIKLPFLSPLNGMLAEVFVDIYKITKDESYLIKAREIIDFWSKNEFFEKTDLFPMYCSTKKIFYKIPIIKNYFRYSKLTKYNSTMIEGILNYYKVTKNKDIEKIIKKWIKGFIDKYYNLDGSVNEVLIFKKGIEGKAPELKSFAMIDTFCEFYYVFKEKEYLDIAKKISDYWISNINLNTSLPYQKIGENYSYFDSITDFCIGLRRVYELSGEEEYLKWARKITYANIKYHKKEHGFINSVDVRTGDIIESKVETRFCGLFLKTMIQEENLGKGFENDNVHSLLRDR